MISIVLVGLNHRTAELSVREKAAFEASRLPEALRVLTSESAIQEAIIVSTCNRVELLAATDDSGSGIQVLESFITESSGIDPHHLSKSLYRHAENDAVRHIFRVASSLDSMILGEPQILGQVKNSYSVAVEAQTVGACLNSLLQAAFRVAKRVRSETSIGEYSVSISSAAVDLARKIFGDLRTKSILIIGAGKMGELAVRHLASSGAGTIRVSNRSPEAAQDLALQFNGVTVPFGEITRWIAKSDIVITSTGAQEFLITRASAEVMMRERKNSPIILIDIAVPRNIDPRVGSIDNVFCYDIDDLGAVVAANIQERSKEALLAERIVEQEASAFLNRLKQMDTAPVVAQVQQRIQEICRFELSRFLRKKGQVPEKDAQELEIMVTRIANKIAHPLITQIRNGHSDLPNHEAFLTIMRRIFGLGGSDHAAGQKPVQDEFFKKP